MAFSDRESHSRLQFDNEETAFEALSERLSGTWTAAAVSPHGRAGFPGEFGGRRTGNRREVLVTARGEREDAAEMTSCTELM